MRLDLDIIASKLEGLEETIIVKLIDRAQFRLNEQIYLPGQSGFLNENERSLFELRLFFQESMDSQFGRFKAPEERPFCQDLPPAMRVVSMPPSGLVIDDFDLINLGPVIKTSYLELLKKLCRPGDDSQYGSSTEHDVYALQAIARRIHFGSLYISECKFSADPETYSELIMARDVEALNSKLTRKEVEDKIIDRVREKVESIQSKANPKVRYLINSDAVVEYYRNIIIPLTKKGEITYLLQRLK